MKKIRYIIFVSILALTFSACSDSKSYEDIKATDLDEFMSEHPDYVYIDVRTPEELKQGYVDGFENIVNTDIINKKVDLSKDETYVIICRSGNRSSAVAKYLVSEGYENIYNVKGGIIEYDGDNIIY